MVEFVELVESVELDVEFVESVELESELVEDELEGVVFVYWVVSDFMCCSFFW